MNSQVLELGPAPRASTPSRIVLYELVGLAYDIKDAILYASCFTYSSCL